MNKATVVDFESKGILPRPYYPPQPVGVSIWFPGKKPEYEAWGHPTENGLFVMRGEKAIKIAEPSRERAAKKLKDAWKGKLLFHHARFDSDVGYVWFGLPDLSYDQYGDTMFRLFLKDPHVATLALKPNSERFLGMPPEERDEVRQWLVDHGICAANASDDEFGMNLWRAPGRLVAKYSIGDVLRTKGLDECKKLALDRREQEAYERELRVMPIFLRNERGGLRLDVDRLEHDLILYEWCLDYVEQCCASGSRLRI